MGSTNRPLSNRLPRLKRALVPMPAFVRKALAARRLAGKYAARPPYQRNDYIAWITRPKLPATRHRRLEQMLDELDKGDVYMKMAYRAHGS
jgi:uncharacterized protein YdeI (YjbR/CyaY-like superfamily)